MRKNTKKYKEKLTVLLKKILYFINLWHVYDSIANFRTNCFQRLLIIFLTVTTTDEPFYFLRNRSGIFPKTVFQSLPKSLFV